MTSVLTRAPSNAPEPTDVVALDQKIAPSRRRSRLGIGAVVVLLAELTASILGPLGPTPIEWRDQIVQLKVEQMDRRGTAEVVLAGTSMVMQGINPSGLDGDVYNAAIDAAVPATQEDWLLDRVVPRLQPRTVVWGISPMDLNGSSDHPWVHSYYEASAVKDGFFGAAERLGRDWSALVRYRTELREPGEFIEGLGAGEDWRPAEITADGYRDRFDQSPTDQHRSDTAAFFERYGEAKTDGQLIASITAELQRNGVEVILAMLPIPDRTVELLPGGRVDVILFEARLRAVAATTGAPLLDLTDGLTDDRFFTDYAHHTEQGAALLTQRLNELLPSVL